MLLLHPASLECCPTEKLHKVWGLPKLFPIKRSDGKPLPENVPSHAIERTDVVARCENIGLTDAQALLLEFGEAFQPATDPRTELRTPLIFRPPEHILPTGTPVTYTADIWMLACTLFVILGQRNVFETFIELESQVLVEQIDALGPVPEEMFQPWEKRAKYFTDQQQPVNRGKDGPTETFSERIVRSATHPRRKYDYGEIVEEELLGLEELLRSMLAMKASDRISAEQVLESEWTVKSVLPDLERAREIWKQSEQAIADAPPKLEADAKLQDVYWSGAPSEQGTEGPQAKVNEMQEEAGPAETQATAGEGQEELHAPRKDQEGDVSGENEPAESKGIVAVKADEVG